MRREGRAISAAAGSRDATVRVVVATRRNGRPRNEDAVGVAGWVLHGETPGVAEMHVPLPADRPLVLALADGIGGHRAGDVAARLTVEHLTRARPTSAADLATALVGADGALRAAGATDAALTAMGATAVVAALTVTGELWVAHAGDVRAYRVIDGYPLAVTVDDRPAGDLGAVGGAVTRLVGGTRPTVDPGRNAVETLPASQRLLLCTDGVHDVVAPDTLRRCLRADLPAAATRLLDEAGPAGDNATVVLATIAPGHPPARPPSSTLLLRRD